MLPAVNFHVWKFCNYRCRFCFATFEDVPGQLRRPAALRIVEELARYGCDKLTFVGGEPTLCPFLGELVERAAALGLTTSIVSNGERLGPLIEQHAAALHWVGLSVDSGDEATSQRLGRGTGGHVERSIELAELAHRHGIRVKLNTVVTAINQHEDMTAVVRRIRPERWKIFQVLPITGQNDGIDALLVSPDEFRGYVARHARLADDGIAIVPEDNAAMTGSYIMIDAMGRFFDNVEGRLIYGPPILDVGVEQAFVAVRWERERMVARNGLYPWRRRT